MNFLKINELKHSSTRVLKNAAMRTYSKKKARLRTVLEFFYETSVFELETSSSSLFRSSLTSLRFPGVLEYCK